MATADKGARRTPSEESADTSEGPVTPQSWRRRMLWGLLPIGILLLVFGVLLSRDRVRVELSELVTLQHVCMGIAALLPAIVVLQHGIYLNLSRPDKQHNGRSRNGQAQMTIPEEILRSTRRETRDMFTTHYGREALILDYGLPTVLNLIAGLALAYVLCETLECCGHFPLSIQNGVRFGGIGAYVYVIMLLGSRTFQRDVSPGIAIWGAIQMVIGPILGGVVAAVLSPDAVTLNQFAREAIYFFAGLAPRHIVLVIQDTVARFFGGNQPAVSNKQIPITQIRGITPTIADRLSEEGIGDGYQLAMANPIRLMRNTPFDERQILAWIDEAFLYSVLPDYAQALQKEGVTGAVDLAYYFEMYDDEAEAKESRKAAPAANRRETVGGAALPIPELGLRGRVKRLADLVRMDPGSLLDTIQRLYEDRQVEIVWTLYYDLNPYDENNGSNVHADTRVGST